MEEAEALASAAAAKLAATHALRSVKVVDIFVMVVVGGGLLLMLLLLLWEFRHNSN